MNTKKTIWDIELPLNYFKDRLRNCNLLLKARFNTANRLHIFYRIEFEEEGWVKERKHKFRQ